MSAEKSDLVASSAADPARDFLEFWKHYFEQTALQTRVLLESMPGGKPPDQFQNQALAALSDSLDGFMRTPAFLDVLKQSLTRMIELKKAQDQVAQNLGQQTGLPLAADVAGVVEQVRSAQQVLLRRLDRLDARLEAIEKILTTGPVEKSPRRKKANTRQSGDDVSQDPA